jgi:hypothetical protein
MVSVLYGFIMGDMKQKMIIEVAGDFDQEPAASFLVAILEQDHFLPRSEEMIPILQTTPEWTPDTEVRWFGINE